MLKPDNVKKIRDLLPARSIINFKNEKYPLDVSFFDDETLNPEKETLQKALNIKITYNPEKKGEDDKSIEVLLNPEVLNETAYYFSINNEDKKLLEKFNTKYWNLNGGNSQNVLSNMYKKYCSFIY